ncbi:hypothetical protein R3P38DRAFT_3172955 [Favolaschia claudopus]|uniref:Uncharacterized protein n=1 Tax=Favolaschia claudopus TaxID=2862362 RepID=A0AAW0DM71_9AGAR
MLPTTVLHRSPASPAETCAPHDLGSRLRSMHAECVIFNQYITDAVTPPSFLPPSSNHHVWPSKQRSCPPPIYILYMSPRLPSPSRRWIFRRRETHAETEEEEMPRRMWMRVHLCSSCWRSGGRLVRARGCVGRIPLFPVVDFRPSSYAISPLFHIPPCRRRHPFLRASHARPDHAISPSLILVLVAWLVHVIFLSRLGRIALVLFIAIPQSYPSLRFAVSPPPLTPTSTYPPQTVSPAGYVYVCMHARVILSNVLFKQIRVVSPPPTSLPPSFLLLPQLIIVFERMKGGGLVWLPQAITSAAVRVFRARSWNR